VKKKATSKTKKDPNWGAWVWIRWKPGTPAQPWKAWMKQKQVKEAWTTTGDWDCRVSVDAHNPDELEKIVWDTIRSNQWVDKTETQWVKKCW